MWWNVLLAPFGPLGWLFGGFLTAILGKAFLDSLSDDEQKAVEKTVKSKDPMLFLTGRSGAGKDTFMYLLEKAIFKAEYEATSGVERKVCRVSLSQNISYHICIINTGGSRIHDAENVAEVENLQKLKQEGIKVYYAYIFDASLYDKQKTQIQQEIKSHKGICDRSGFDFVIVGTHKDKLSGDAESIKKELSNLGRCEIYDLTRACGTMQREAFKFIGAIK